MISSYQSSNIDIQTRLQFTFSISRKFSGRRGVKKKWQRHVSPKERKKEENNFSRRVSFPPNPFGVNEPTSRDPWPRCMNPLFAFIHFLINAIDYASRGPPTLNSTRKNIRDVRDSGRWKTGRVDSRWILQTPLSFSHSLYARSMVKKPWMEDQRAEEKGE